MSPSPVRIAVVTLLAACCAGGAHGQTVATWNVNGNGTWNVNGNWASSDGLFPNGVGAVARLTNDITASSTVTITSPVTVGTLAIGDSAGTSTFTLAGSNTSNTLTFDVSSGRGTMTKSSGGSDTISARVLLAKDFTFTNTSGGLVDVTGGFNETGGTRNMLFDGTGGGRFQFGNGATSTVSGTLTVNGNTTVSVRHGATRLGSISSIDVKRGTFYLGDPTNRTVANNVVNTAATFSIGGETSGVSSLYQTNFGGTNGNVATQTFAGLTLNTGYSRFGNDTTGSGTTNQSNLNFGTTNFSRSAGSILYLAPLDAATFGTRTVTTATTASTNFGGTRLVIGVVTGSGLGALVQQDGTTGVWSTLTSSTNPAAPDANTFALYTSSTSAPASSSFASIQVQNATLTLSGTNTVGSGMVLLGNPATSNGATLTGGTIRSDTSELILMTPSSVNGFTNTVGSVIADKDGSTPTKLTVGLAGASNTNFTRIALNAANTFSGETTVVSFTSATNNYLQIGHSLALQNSTLNNSTARGVVFSGITAATFGGLSGTANQPLVNTATSAVALKVGNNDASTIYHGALSGAGSLEKIGSGTLRLTGSSSYTGATTITNGVLRVDGSIASSSGVSLAAAGTLMGSGFVAAISGTGLVSPGNSPGILTAPSVNLGSGIDFAFEFFQAGQPTWGSATASGNDVLRLTDGTAPIAGTVSAGNVFDIYFLATGDTYTGGLFTDLNSDFQSLLAGATFNYYVQDAGGAVNFGGNTYRSLNAGDVSFDVVQIGSAAFADQTVTNGYAMQFVVSVPEPTGLALAAVGVTASALAARLRRRRRPRPSPGDGLP